MAKAAFKDQTLVTLVESLILLLGASPKLNEPGQLRRLC